MVATPFKASVVLYPVAGGAPRVVSMSGSDIANAYLTNDDDGLTYLSVPLATKGYEIRDVQLSAAGVDTTRLRLIVDGIEQQITFRDAFLADTSVPASARVPPGVGVSAGKQIQFKQLA